MTAKYLSEVASSYGKIHGVGIFQVRQTPHKICQILAKSPACAQNIVRNVNGSRHMGQDVVASLATCAIPRGPGRNPFPTEPELQPLGRFWTSRPSTPHEQQRSSAKSVKRTEPPTASSSQGNQQNFKRRKGLLGDAPTCIIRPMTPPETQQLVLDHFMLIENTIQLSGEGIELFYNAEDDADWRKVTFLLNGGITSVCRPSINTVHILQNSLEDSRSIDLAMQLSKLPEVTKLIFPAIRGFWQERVNSALQLLTTKYHETLRTVRNVQSLNAVSSDVVDRATVIRVLDLAYPPVASARVLSLFAELPEARETVATFGCSFPNPPYCNSRQNRRITLQIRTAFPLSLLDPVQRSQDLCRSITDIHLVTVIKHKHEETIKRMGSALQNQLSQLRDFFPRLRYFHFRLALEEVLHATNFTNSPDYAASVAAHVENLVRRVVNWSQGFTPPFQQEIRFYYDFEFASSTTEDHMATLAEAHLEGVLQSFYMRTLESGPDRWTVQSSMPTKLVDKVRIAFHQPSSTTRPSRIQYTHEGEWTTEQAHMMDDASL